MFGVAKSEHPRQKCWSTVDVRFVGLSTFDMVLFIHDAGCSAYTTVVINEQHHFQFIWCH